MSGTVLLAVLAILVLAMGISQAQEPEPEPEAAVQAIGVGSLSASDVVSSAISYQGRLTDDSGNSLDGTYDIGF